MATSTPARDGRIELRATKDEKQLLSAAAAYEHLDVTSFIMRNAIPAAQAVVERSERIKLSRRDSTRVLELLENPPKPTPALLEAARNAPKSMAIDDLGRTTHSSTARQEALRLRRAGA